MSRYNSKTRAIDAQWWIRDVGIEYCLKIYNFFLFSQIDLKLEKASALNMYCWRLSDLLMYISVAFKLSNVAVWGLSTVKKKNKLSVHIIIFPLAKICEYFNLHCISLTLKTWVPAESFFTQTGGHVTNPGKTGL